MGKRFTQLPARFSRQTNSDSVETTVRRRTLLSTGFMARMGEEWLLKRMMLGERAGGKG